MAEQDTAKKVTRDFAEKLLNANADSYESLRHFQEMVFKSGREAGEETDNALLAESRMVAEKYLKETNALIISSQPRDGISHLRLVTDEVEQQSLDYLALKDKYLKIADPKGLQSDDPYFLRNALLNDQSLPITREERINFLARESVLSKLAIFADDEKERLIRKVDGSSPNPISPIEPYKHEAMENALEAVRVTIAPAPANAAPQPPSPYDPDLLRVAEEYRLHKDSLPVKSGNGPRPTPVVESQKPRER